MAELAAKIRAKFRRRHSAIPGIPSLLSRTSIRSSSGSHGSSLFRPFSHGHTSRSSTNHDPDPDHADTEDASRVGSSRVSVNDDSKDDAESAEQSKDTTITSNGSIHAFTEDSAPPKAEGGEQATTADQNEACVVAQAGDGDETDTAQEAAQQHNNGSTETSRIDSSSASPVLALPTAPAPVAVAAPDSSETSSADVSSSTGVDTNSLFTTTSTAASPAAAAAAALQPALTTNEAPTVLSPLTDSEPSPSSTFPNAIPARDPPDLQQHMQPSDMSGKDRQPALRKLSIVNEQPSPDKLRSLDDNLADSIPLVHSDQHDSVPLSSVTVALPAPPAPAVVASSIAPKRRNDDNLRPSRTALRNPNRPLSPSRPLHIHLPPASFGGPNPNLSPGGAVSSYTSNTAPTSPLRHSTLAPSAPARRHSLLANRQSTLIQSLLRGTQAEDPSTPNVGDQLLPISDTMVTRKIWVKRPGASATLVTINEDDLVDDVREMILRKYANSLGRQFDAPDLTLRIRPNGNQQERMLGPEEPMSRTLDAYFPSGQTIDDALVIDTPLRRTPRASPRVGPPHAPHIQYYVEDPRPPETAGDYFGPGAVSALPVTVTAPSAGSGHSHAISVLSTGQVPQIPSPGGRRARDYRERPERPRLGRQHTSSPTLINLASGAAHQGSIASAVIAPHGMHTTHTTRPRSRTHSEASDASLAAPQPPLALPTPPPAEPASAVPQRIATPPPRVASPRLKKNKKKTDHPQLPKGMLNGTVPPINVLIVEDNIINLKLLEAFVKRLKVRWSTAMNGRDAVLKWRGGGFHLVLMDIQLPIMSGLDATREIRRLERVNSIGVFSSAASSAPEEAKGEPVEKDRLENKDLFKSPVIIVALTASSLQSDRHEALAAGCNDFLTKPVNFVWLERKVMEWGCMQALIDFDGWRQWKDFSAQQVDDRAKAAAALKAKSKRNRSSLTLGAVAAGA